MNGAFASLARPRWCVYSQSNTQRSPTSTSATASISTTWEEMVTIAPRARGRRRLGEGDVRHRRHRGVRQGRAMGPGAPWTTS